MRNRYSATWFELFLEKIDPAQTEREAAFVSRWLPRPTYTTVLDLCCGRGRHARAFAKCGYRVTGIDLSETALEAARSQSGDHIVYYQWNMRDLDSLPETFDAVVCLWQSFGYFDTATNAEVLRQIGRKLKPGGRLVLDIYHREFFEQNQGVRNLESAGVAVTETKKIDGDRLCGRLEYGSGGVDEFEWQLFTPGSIRDVAKRCGFATLVCCSGFDESTAASPDTPRMQLVCERQQA